MWKIIIRFLRTATLMAAMLQIKHASEPINYLLAFCFISISLFFLKED